MKLFTVSVIAMMLISTVAMAGEVPTSAGDKAMIFMFQGLDDLHLDGYGHDYGFGMRYYISDGTAIRGGILFGMNSWTDESGTEDWEASESSFGLEAVYEKHMEGPCASVSPFWGLGGNYSTWSVENDNDDSMTENFYGIFGVAGFEWGFTDCITLGGEYRLGFESGTYEEEDDGNVIDEGSVTMTGFGTASVFLSVYW